MPNEWFFGGTDSLYEFLTQNPLGIIILSAGLVGLFRNVFRRTKPHIEDTFENRKFFLYGFVAAFGFLIAFFGNNLIEACGLAFVGSAVAFTIQDLWEDYLFPYLKRDTAHVIAAVVGFGILVLAPSIAETFGLPTLLVALGAVGLISIVVYSKYKGSTTFARNVKATKDKILRPIDKVQKALLVGKYKPGGLK